MSEYQIPGPKPESRLPKAYLKKDIPSSPGSSGSDPEHTTVLIFLLRWDMSNKLQELFGLNVFDELEIFIGVLVGEDASALEFDIPRLTESIKKVFLS